MITAAPLSAPEGEYAGISPGYISFSVSFFATTGLHQSLAGRAEFMLGHHSAAACGVGRSLRPEFLIALGCVSSGEQPGCFLDFDGLHQYAFLPIG